MRSKAFDKEKRQPGKAHPRLRYIIFIVVMVCCFAYLLYGLYNL